MKKFLAITMSLVLSVALLSSCSGSGNGSGGASSTPSGSASTSGESAYQEMTLKLACDGMAETAIDMYTAVRFAECVSEMTDGAITIEIFGSNQLSGGNQQKAIEMLTQGTTELAVYSNSIAGGVLDERILAASIPFAFSSYDEVVEIYNTTGGAFVNEALAPHNVTYLGMVHNGFRNISNNKNPIATPDDMKNLKIRVMSSEMYLDIFRTLGADPIAMSISELYTALQQGTVDGQDNGFTQAYGHKTYEVQNYYTRINYCYDSFMIFGNSDKLAALPQNVQDVLQAAATEACEKTRTWFVESEEEYVQLFQDSGVEVLELTEAQKEPFKQLLAPVIEKYKAQYGAEACAAFGIA